MFMPPPMTDAWTRWIVGDWEGTGASDSGKGSGTAHIETALGGQFLVCRGQAKITELNPDYLKEHMAPPTRRSSDSSKRDTNRSRSTRSTHKPAR